MRRRAFIAGLGGAVMCVRGARAQQPGKVWRVGVLETTPEVQNAANFGAFRQAMRALGYTEGQNLAIEYRSADGRGERFVALAADLLALKVDVIVTRGTPAVLAAKNATASLPVVMAAAGEPLMVVSSLARPGGNITGSSGYTTDSEAKRVETIKELIPGVARIAALYNMGNPVAPGQWSEVQTAAQTLGIEPQLLDVRKPEDIGPAFDAASSNRAGALVVQPDALMQTHRMLIAELAAKHRLPTIYVSREFVEAGGLMAYGPNYSDLYRRAATYVDKIFKGAKPSDLPVEQPTRFELIINLKTAKALGLTVPPNLLALADEVIE